MSEQVLADTSARKAKTIFCIYTDKKIENVTAKNKRYSFNTSSDVQVGDMIKTKEYNTLLQVVMILDDCFTYYNESTGEVSNTLTSTLQWKIKTLEIAEEREDIIYGTKV